MPWNTVKLQIPQLSSYLQKRLTFDSGEVHHRRRLKQQGQYRVSFISAIKCHLSDFINYPATHLVWGLDYKSTNHLKFFIHIHMYEKQASKFVTLVSSAFRFSKKWIVLFCPIKSSLSLPLAVLFTKHLCFTSSNLT